MNLSDKEHETYERDAMLKLNRWAADRERIMDTMGTLKDLIDDYNSWVEIEGFYAAEIDKTFSIGLQRFINDIDRFHRSWEDRY